MVESNKLSVKKPSTDNSPYSVDSAFCLPIVYAITAQTFFNVPMWTRHILRRPACEQEKIKKIALFIAEQGKFSVKLMMKSK